MLWVQKYVTSQNCFIHFLFNGFICVGLLGVECWILFLLAWISKKCLMEADLCFALHQWLYRTADCNAFAFLLFTHACSHIPVVF